MKGIGLGLGFGSKTHIIPTDLANLRVWLRSDLGVTSDVNGVSSWADQSGNGFDFVQATNANKPALVANAYGSIPSIRGNADGKRFLKNTGATAFSGAGSMFWVLNASTLANTYMADDGTDGLWGVLSKWSGTAIEWFANNGADRLTFITTPGTGLHVIGLVQTDAALLNLYCDSTAVAATKTPAAAIKLMKSIVGLNTGANGSSGDFLEYIAYSRAITTAEISQVIFYLKGRYNIA